MLAIRQREQAQTNHPHVGQTRGDQQAAQTRWLSQVTLVDMKAATFLVREESLDAKAPPVKVSGPASSRQRSDQKKRGIILRSSPDHQIGGQSRALGERNLWDDFQASMCDRKGVYPLPLALVSYQQIACCAHHKLPRGVLLHPRQHLGVIVLGVPQ